MHICTPTVICTVHLIGTGCYTGSFGCICLCKQILVEMSSHILIFGGFTTSLLDDIHVILGHNPYPLGSSGICLVVHTIVIKRMILVMKF